MTWTDLWEFKTGEIFPSCFNRTKGCYNILINGITPFLKDPKKPADAYDESSMLFLCLLLMRDI